MVDRRGRGGSGDAPTYSIDREAEDIARVIDAIVDPVRLWGSRTWHMGLDSGDRRSQEVGHRRIRRRPVLGRLMNEYERAA